MPIIFSHSQIRFLSLLHDFCRNFPTPCFSTASPTFTRRRTETGGPRAFPHAPRRRPQTGAVHPRRDRRGGPSGAVGRHRRPADGQAGPPGDGDTAVLAARAVHGTAGPREGAPAVRAAR